MRLTLNTNKNTYEWDITGKHRSVYGELFIEIDGIKFPSEGWIDIISSVLIMWIDNITDLLQSDLKGEKEMFFMDGPYMFKIIGTGMEMIRIDLFKNSQQYNNESYSISFYNLLQEISNIIIDIGMDDRLKEVSNVNELKRKFIALKKIAQSKGYNVKNESSYN